MNIQIDDFFQPVGLINIADKEGSSLIQDSIDFANAFSLSTYQSLYIIDYSCRGFAYVSDNPLFLCGNKPSEVRDMGYAFYLNYVPPKDLEMLLEINSVGFQFFKESPIERRKNFCISYDFHLIRRKGHEILVNHKLTPLLLDTSSNIWLALCAVSLSANSESGNIVVRELGSKNFYRFDLSSKSWNSHSHPKISISETEILMTINQGHTVEQIASMFNISPSTVKFHRQNILRKLNVRNISEALAFATNYNLI